MIISPDLEIDPSLPAEDDIARALPDWLADCDYDPQAGRLIESRRVCTEAAKIARTLAAFAPGLRPPERLLDQLFAFIPAAKLAAARPGYSLAGRVRAMVDHFEREAANYLDGGLDSLGAGEVSLYRQDNVWFVRGALFEIYNNIRAFLEEAGFFDTIAGPRKKVVVVHGRYRTGSTLVYNAIMHVLETAGESVRAIGSDWERLDRFIDHFREGAYSGRWLLLKSHNWLPRAASDDVVAIHTRRNLADVAASLMGLWERNGKLRTIFNTEARRRNSIGILAEVEFQKLINDFAVDDRKTNVIDYDLYRENLPRLVVLLADLLKVQLPPGGIEEVVRAIDPERTRIRLHAMPGNFDEKTQLRKRHLSEALGRTGGLLHTLPGEVREGLKRLNEWPLDWDPPHRNAVIQQEEPLENDMNWATMLTLALDYESGKAVFLILEAAFTKRLRGLLAALRCDTEGFETDQQLIAGAITEFVAIANGSKEADERIRQEVMRHVQYHAVILARSSTTPLEAMGDGIRLLDPTPETMGGVERSLKELLKHCSASIGYSLDIPPEDFGSNASDFSIMQSGGRNLFAAYLPKTIRELRTEAHLQLIEPWFFKGLKGQGDICEFGCFQGTMSIKFAAILQAMQITDKNVYAFDTFEGFQIDDPGGGSLGVGAYSDAPDTFSELTKWGRILPVKPVKGDATVTCRDLRKPLCFVWMDLDMAVLMAPVLDRIWPLLREDTVIGIDDVGRPETPTVLPWVQQLVAEGRLIQLQSFPKNYVAFFQINTKWVSPRVSDAEPETDG